MILLIVYLPPSVSMYIGQGLSLKSRRATQAERRAANTATVTASTPVAAAAATESASSASIIGHGIGGKYIPIMVRLAKARRWSKR